MHFLRRTLTHLRFKHIAHRELLKLDFDSRTEFENHTGERDVLQPTSINFSNSQGVKVAYQARVTLSCPEKGEVAGKLVLLPRSIQELLEIGAKKFGISVTKILTQEGAEVEDVNLLRDGDRLVLVSDAGAAIPSSHQVS